MKRDIELDENITRYIENRNNFVEFRKMRRFDLNNWSVPTNEIINISRTFLYDLIDENLAVAEWSALAIWGHYCIFFGTDLVSI